MRPAESISPLIEQDEGGLLNGLIRRVRTASRQKRAKLFHSLFEIRPDTRILDLGGGDGSHIHYLLAATAARRENVCVAAGYFVQVPCRWFPVETHSWLPFLGIAPRPLQCRVIAIANRVWIKKTIPDFYLPSADEMARHFPGATLMRERFMGLTKSLIAVRRVQKETRNPIPATVAS